jgi:hypothetical protein
MRKEDVKINLLGGDKGTEYPPPEIAAIGMLSLYLSKVLRRVFWRMS